MGKKISIKQIALIQAAVIIYTFGSISLKLASNHDFMTLPFLFFLFLSVFFLGVYAIFWQQIIKRFDLSLAYANRAFAIFWSMLWAAVIFGERVTIKNIIGVVIIFAGIMVVNSDEY